MNSDVVCGQIFADMMTVHLTVLQHAISHMLFCTVLQCIALYCGVVYCGLQVGYNEAAGERDGTTLIVSEVPPEEPER
jgi:hypothetical protein